MHIAHDSHRGRVFLLPGHHVRPTKRAGEFPRLQPLLQAHPVKNMAATKAIHLSIRFKLGEANNALLFRRVLAPTAVVEPEHRGLVQEQLHGTRPVATVPIPRVFDVFFFQPCDADACKMEGGEEDVSDKEDGFEYAYRD